MEHEESGKANESMDDRHFLCFSYNQGIESYARVNISCYNVKEHIY
jgi:hypothetical protein